LPWRERCADVLETTLAVSPPAPAHDAVAVPALTPTEFLHAILLDGPRPAKTIERMAQEQHGWRFIAGHQDRPSTAG
jgi:hypothetical protein